MEGLGWAVSRDSGPGQGAEGRSGASAGGRRPLLERLGLAGIAVVLALLFGGVAVASWVGGELFLAVMAAIGALMTAWAGAITLFRG
ncbi:MAG: hypothetical protein AB1736_00695 [Chloroflexota bacterium]